jgi:NTP pyrophosphatase (non-canonical NTP hydrolase)
MIGTLIQRIRDAILPPSFQSRVRPWLVAAFTEDFDKEEHAREARFIEEAIELFQAKGRSFEELISVAKYVYSRPAGEIRQEVGGVMTTLAALCIVSKLDMHEAGEAELARIWTEVDAIREKQANKPRHSPLPGATPGERIPENNWQPTEAQINSACMSYRHDFGLLEGEERERIRSQARWWLQAWMRELPKTPALREIKAPKVIEG